MNNTKLKEPIGLGKPFILNALLKKTKNLSPDELAEINNLTFPKLLSEKTRVNLQKAVVKLSDMDFNHTEIVELVFKPLSLPRYIRGYTEGHRKKKQYHKTIWPCGHPSVGV